VKDEYFAASSSLLMSLVILVGIIDVVLHIVIGGKQMEDIIHISQVHTQLMSMAALNILFRSVIPSQLITSRLQQVFQLVYRNFEKNTLTQTSNISKC